MCAMVSGRLIEGVGRPIEPVGRPIEPVGLPHILGRYQLLHHKLGSGNYASVVAAKHLHLEVQVAVKIIDTSKVGDQYVLRHLAREAALLRRLSHPNIIAVFESIKAGPLYCLVTELVSGGELGDHVSRQADGHLDEVTTRRFAGQLLSALAHMHDHGVVHRDLKMKNILLNEDRDLVKIIDFGLSNEWSPESPLQTHCGSPGYAAPEVYVLSKPYGPKVDMWSLGVVLYGMAVGSLPFSNCRDKTISVAERRRRLIAQISKGITQDHVNAMAHFSASFTDLVFGLLTPEPPDRLSVQNALLHPWLKTYESPPTFQLSTSQRTFIVAKLAVLLKMSVETVEQDCAANSLGEVAAAFNILAHQQLSKYYKAWESQPPSRIKSNLELERVCSGEDRTSAPLPPRKLDSYERQEQKPSLQDNLNKHFLQLTLTPKSRTEDLMSANLSGFTTMRKSLLHSDYQSVAPHPPISKPTTKIVTSLLPNQAGNTSKSLLISQTTAPKPLEFQAGIAATLRACRREVVDRSMQTSSHDLIVSHQKINSLDLEDVQQKEVSVSIPTERGVCQSARDMFAQADNEHTLNRSSVSKQSCREVTLGETQRRVELSQKLKLITEKRQSRTLLKSACPSQHTACSKEVQEIKKNNQSCSENGVNKALSTKTGPVSRYMMNVTLEESLGRTKYMTLRPWRIWSRNKKRSAQLPKYTTTSLKTQAPDTLTSEHKQVPGTSSPKATYISQKLGYLKMIPHKK